jgi:hypothetical protein
VLVAIMVMLVIIVPLTGAFVLGVGRSTQSLQDAGNSADTQVLAAFFETDVAQAVTVSTTSTCGAGAGRTVVLALSWTDGASQTVSYVAESDPDAAAQAGAASAWRLERVACGPESSSNVVVAQANRIPSVRCDGAPCTGSAPRRVSLAVTQHARQITGDAVDGAYSYTVTGIRKVTA